MRRYSSRKKEPSLPSPAIVVAGGSGVKGASASSSWSAPVSYARVSACFVDASRTALRRWLDSPIVCAPLAYHSTVANATPPIDERRSGLLELLRHHAYCDAQEALRVALDKQALPVIQFLVCRDIEHPEEGETRRKRSLSHLFEEPHNQPGSWVVGG